MYQQHFGFSEPPFSISPDPRFLYMSERHREALAHLVYGAGENGGFVLLTGQVGTGKTTLIRSLFQQSIDDVDFALCLYSGFSEIEFLSLILDELGAPYSAQSNRKDLVYALNQHALKVHAEGRKIVIIIDEAQNLSRDLLEQIRLLTNLETNTQKLLRIILVGQEELQDLLADNSLRQLSQRITTRYHLTALNLSEVDEYISYRLQVAGGSPLIIPKAVRRRVYQLSKGTPRLVNVICERALLGAYADDRNQLTARDVELAAARALPQSQKTTPSDNAECSPQWHLRYFLVSLAILAATIGFLRTDMSKQLLTTLFHEANVSDDVRVTENTPVTQEPSAVMTTDVQASVETTSDEALLAQKQAALAALQASQSDDETALSTDEAASETRDEKDVATVAEEVQAADDGNAVLGESEQTTTGDGSLNTVALASEIEPTVDEKAAEVVVPKNELDSVYQDGVNRAALAQRLARMWGKSSALSLDKAYCDALGEERLVCIGRQASLTLIKKLNRPALLQISPSQVSTSQSVWVLLTGIGGERVSIETPKGRREVSFDALAKDYTGNAFFVLRQPNAKFAVKPGQQGGQVSWLRERLQFYRHEPVSLQTQSLKYDAALREEVRAFQREHSLDVDGVVGEDTLLYLYNLVATEETPTLRK